MSKYTILGVKFLFVVGLWQSFQRDCFLDALVTLHDAYCMAVYAVKRRCWFTLGDCYEVQSLFWDLSLFFGYCFVYTMRPRDVRSYFANCLVVSRQLCVPLRYCQMLELLSWADILTFELANCNAKLHTLEKMLGLKIGSEFADVKANLNGAEEKNVASFSTDNDSSLQRKNYELNEFLTHHRECSCTCCTCFEYQRLLMQCLILRAAFCAFSNRKIAAGEIFKGISPLIEKLQTSVNSKEYSNIHLIFISNFVKYKLVLGDYYASMNMFEEANECNATAERNVDGIFCWIPLTCDIIDQREALDIAAFEYENDEKGILKFIELKNNDDETKLDQLVSKFKELVVESLPADTVIVDTALPSEQSTVVADSSHCDTAVIAVERRNRTKSSARPRRLFTTMNDTKSSKRITKKTVPEKQSSPRINASISTRRKAVPEKQSSPRINASRSTRRKTVKK